MLISSNIKRIIAKCGGIVVGMVQFGCITHCALEYVGDFVVVSSLFLSDVCGFAVYLCHSSF